MLRGHASVCVCVCVCLCVCVWVGSGQHVFSKGMNRRRMKDIPRPRICARVCPHLSMFVYAYVHMCVWTCPLTLLPFACTHTHTHTHTPQQQLTNMLTCFQPCTHAYERKTRHEARQTAHLPVVVIHTHTQLSAVHPKDEQRQQQRKKTSAHAARSTHVQTDNGQIPAEVTVRRRREREREAEERRKEANYPSGMRHSQAEQTDYETHTQTARPTCKHHANSDCKAGQQWQP